jgi:Protein of unknown function (DUF3352)
MKKLLLGILVVAALGAGGYFIWLHYFQTSYPESVFPADTVAYVYFHDVEEAAKNLPKTTLWQQIEKSPRRKIYEKQLGSLVYFIQTATGIDPHPLLQQFTRELALALFPLPDHKSGAAFVAYIKSEADTERFLNHNMDPNLKRRIPDLMKSGLSYNGVIYYRYSSSRLPDGITPSYAVTNHHLLMSSTEASLKALLDVKKGKSDPLKKSAVFEEAKKRISYKRGLLIFVDAQKALDMIRDSLSPARQKFWPAVMKISGVNGLQSFAYSVSVAGEGFDENGYLELKPQREGLLKIYFEQKPQKLHSTAAIPPDSKVVNSGTLADFAKMWDEVNAQLNTILSPADYDKWQKLLNAMKGIFNFDPRRDLFEPLGNEFCFSYEAPEGNISDPTRLKYLLIIQLRNPQKFRETLDRAVSLASLRGLQQKQETYNGKKLQRFDLQLAQFSISPAYCLDGSWFYFSTHIVLLKKAIDAQTQKKNIETLTDYQKVTAGFPDEVNSLSYTNVSAYLQMYSAILNRQANDPENRWIQEYGLQQEFASLGQTLFGAASYSRIEKDGMYIHSYASVPTSFLALPAIVSALPEIIKQYNSRHND